MRSILATAILVALAAGAPAMADPAEDAAQARIAFMDLIGREVGALAAMAKGDVAYAPEAAATHAANLAALAAYDYPGLMIAGSTNDALAGKTRALPAAVTDKAGLMAEFGKLKAAAAALQTKAGGGRAELGGALGPVGETCRSCHTAYRAKDF